MAKDKPVTKKAAEKASIAKKARISDVSSLSKKGKFSPERLLYGGQN
jgi:hypothetical protein